MSISSRSPLLLLALILLAGVPSTSLAMGPDSSASAPSYRPDPASVSRFGPGYRYPKAGWIVLHIEGGPYERGYQHGRLMAPEIAAFMRRIGRSIEARGTRRRLARTYG